MVRRESCTSLAGASRARVGAGAPGSRLRLRGEIPVTERSVESLEGGSNETGRNPMNAVQASSEDQPKGVWEGRAGHVTAEAIDSALGPERVLDLPGVVAAARFERAVRNTRGPTWQPRQAQTVRIKPVAEIVRSREGVRGVRSTDEGGEKPLEGRDPALVAPVLEVSARAWA